MKLNFLRKKQKAQIGLDITAEGITAILLTKENKKICLKDFYFEPFSQDAIQNGIISNQEVFVETLTKICSCVSFNTNLVNIAVPGNTAFIKTITLPDLSEDEIRIIASQEAVKHIPFQINEANVDFAVIESSRRQENSIRRVDIILAALTKSIANNYIDLISKAGLSVNIIDIAPFVMIKTLANAELIDDSDNYHVSVLIGHENTDINIIFKGMPIFSHNIPAGKANILEALVSGLEISKNEAEKLLTEIILLTPGMEANLDPQLSKAASIVRTIYNTISSEIQKIIEFYRSQSTEVKEITSIIIGGSGACIQNIDKYFTSRLRIETKICSSLKNIEFDEKIHESLSHKNIPALATGIGLALRGLEN